jgi:hypothetical protein
MATSLMKFMNRKDGGSRGQLHWGRADIDGLPFRGSQVPLYRNDEAEERLVRVRDPKNGTFYTGDPEQNAKYLDVLDGAANGWYEIPFLERWRNPDDNYHYVYVEWLECCYEDGTKIVGLR